MPYDIYGSPLKAGYCEVHPDVPESYPCYYCFADDDRRATEREQERQYVAHCHAEQEADYCRYLCREYVLGELVSGPKTWDQLLVHGPPWPDLYEAMSSLLAEGAVSGPCLRLGKSTWRLTPPADRAG